MTGIRIFLGLQAIIWLPYGILCFLDPSTLEGGAGLQALTGTARTELRAMYGGLQAAIGTICLVAAFRPHLVPLALGMLACLAGGLAVARLGGLFLDGDASGYTAFALVFEIVTVAAAATLLRGLGPAAGAAES